MFGNWLDIRIIRIVFFAYFLASWFFVLAHSGKLIFTIDSLILLVRAGTRSMVKVRQFCRLGIIIIALNLFVLFRVVEALLPTMSVKVRLTSLCFGIVNHVKALVLTACGASNIYWSCFSRVSLMATGGSSPLVAT